MAKSGEKQGAVFSAQKASADPLQEWVQLSTQQTPRKVDPTHRPGAWDARDPKMGNEWSLGQVRASPVCVHFRTATREAEWVTVMHSGVCITAPPPVCPVTFAKSLNFSKL